MARKSEGGRTNRLTQLQTIKLSDKLKEVCRAENGVATYQGEWDDEKVLAAMGAAYTISNVTKLRRILIGHLRSENHTSRAETIADLVLRLEALEAWAAQRPVQRYVPPAPTKGATGVGEAQT